MKTRPHPAAESMAAATSNLDPILRFQPACQYIGVGRTTMYSLMRSGALAGSLKVGARARGFRLSTLDGFLDSCSQTGDVA